MALAAGTLLGRYEIRAQLGAGGMGEVYLAQDTRLERTIALKILPGEVANDSQRMHRFVQEAKAAAALNHPNIAHIYEIGETDSTSFIAMEFIDGKTLGQILKQGQLAVTAILDISIQIASALAAAHEAGIVHRDIKPDNVMLRSDGLVKVLDFGLVKLTEPQSATDTEAPTKALVHTDAGTVMGTANYMSPEQARGQKVDVRTDIWSLGVMLYEMTTGHLPFSGATTTDVVASIVKTEPIPLTRFSPELPSKLEEIVAKSLEKDREERYQTVKDLLVDVRRLRKRLDFEAELERSKPPDSSAGPGTSSGGLSIQTSGNATKTSGLISTQQMSSAEYVVTEIKRLKSAAALVLLTLLTAVSAIIYFSYLSRRANATIDSIAVLPFTNQSGDENADYLSDGIPETIIYSLSQLPNLKVTARNSAFRYKGKDADAQTVGRELGVQAVLTGRLTQRGDNLMVSAEVVDAQSNRLLWGGQYSRKLSDILAVQEEIAREISEKLRLRITGQEQKQLTTGTTDNPEAYQLYLKGRYFWNKRTGDAINKSIEYFNQAIEKDPNYALAYAGLADSYVILTGYTSTPGKEAYPKARIAATKALEINDKLAEAYTARAYIRQCFDWDFANAERDFKRSIEINPNYPTAHQWYGEYLSLMGRHDEAIAELKRAQEFDPLSLIINRELGTAFSFAGQYDQAIEQLRKTLDMDSGFLPAHTELGGAYAQKRMYGEAIAEFEKAISLEKDNAFSLMGLGFTYAVSGKTEDAHRILDQLNELSKRLYVPPTFIAAVYAGLGKNDQAFQWLEKAYNERDEGLIYLNSAAPWRRLSSDPRFASLVRRVGLPQGDPGK
jgi:eukaryotic-like serine/threonine-protein kinase